MDLHSYMSSCSFLCFHHPIFLFKYLICSLFLVLNDGFWSTSRRKICSMWIATATHFLLKLKSTIRRDILEIDFIPGFPLGICIQFFSI